MTEPRRPAPDRPLLARVRERLENLRDRGSSPALAESVGPIGEAPSGVQFPLRLILLTSVGSALLTLGMLWGWQSWSARSSIPIDDQLPFLVEAAAPADEQATADGGEVDPLTPPAVTSPVPAESQPAEASTPEALPDVIVHVSGDVVRPGVVRLAADARVNDAIEAAGGANATADLDRVNLAAPVVDGERIHVPAEGEDPPDIVASIRPPASSGAGEPAPAATQISVDLNTAGLVELQTLPGIGPATAQKIVDTRASRGPFLSVDELLEVDGIGPAKLEELRPFVWVTLR